MDISFSAPPTLTRLLDKYFNQLEWSRWSFWYVLLYTCRYRRGKSPLVRAPGMASGSSTLVRNASLPSLVHPIHVPPPSTSLPPRIIFEPFSPPSYCLCRPALVCRNNREALWALNTQHCCFALSNLSIGFSNSIFFMRTDWTILAYVSGKFALHMTVNSASEFAALEGKFYSISNQLLIQQSYYFQVGHYKDQ